MERYDRDNEDRNWCLAVSGFTRGIYSSAATMIGTPVDLVGKLISVENPFLGSQHLNDLVQDGLTWWWSKSPSGNAECVPQNHDEAVLYLTEYLIGGAGGLIIASKIPGNLGNSLSVSGDVGFALSIPDTLQMFRDSFRELTPDISALPPVSTPALEPEQTPPQVTIDTSKLGM